jgi:hypothetical protein
MGFLDSVAQRRQKQMCRLYALKIRVEKYCIWNGTKLTAPCLGQVILESFRYSGADQGT